MSENMASSTSKGRRLRMGLIISTAVIAFVSLSLISPVPLGKGYHAFADARSLLGLPNALNVLSNIPFVVSGLAGVGWLTGRSSVTAFQSGFEKFVYLVFFIGVACTGLGSLWYHVSPNNERLPFDLLPMTCCFMAILTSVAIERIGLPFGRAIFLPLLLLGCASVAYWYFTEGRGHGDYRYYLFVQFFPPVLIAMMIALFPPSYTGMNYLAIAFFMFVAAKFFELFDSQIYQAGYIVSGHSLKHATAGVACYVILRMLQRRHAIRPIIRAT